MRVERGEGEVAEEKVGGEERVETSGACGDGVTDDLEEDLEGEVGKFHFFSVCGLREGGSSQSWISLA